MTTIYLSSTYEDLRDHRKAVWDALRKSEYTVIAMEDYVAKDDRALKKCLRDVERADIYVGLFGLRYGYVPRTADDNPDGHSITELEFRQADQQTKTECLIFLLDDEASLPPRRWIDQMSGKNERGDRIERLRSDLQREKTVTLFDYSKPDSLASAVQSAVAAHIATRPRPAKAHEPQDPSLESITAPRGPDLDDEIARYRHAIAARHATLELAGFKTRLRVPIELEELYVPLHAMLDLRATGDARFADASEAELRLRETQGIREVPLIEAFREARQRKRRGVVILGDPGSGKTTHLKRLLLGCLRESPGALGLEPDILPVFLPLRELEDLSRGLDAFIEQQLASPHLRAPPGFGTRLLERGHLLLLLDGLDEVADAAQRADVSRWIEAAARDRPTCLPVVTCRFAGYQDEVRLDETFLEFHVRPLSREQSEKFVHNWYRIVETGLAVNPAQGEVTARERAHDLLERLRRPDYRAARVVEMTRNPLLLANLCLVHRDRGQLPQRRADLYEECIDVLLERWREGKGLAINVTAKQGRRALQPAALWLHGEEGRTRAGAEELEPVLDPALQAVKWQGGDARDFLRTVRDESGLLTGWGRDEYGFMHLGFQEYLAACEIRRLAFDEDDRGILRETAERYGQSWWQEVILVLVALGNPSVFVPLMREVVQRPAFVEASELLDLILEDTGEISPVPFAELLLADFRDNGKATERSEIALRTLQRIGLTPRQARAAVAGLTDQLPTGLAQWLDSREHAAERAAAHETIRTTPGDVELVAIPGGTFVMGSPESEPGRHESQGPQHRVQIRPFYLGRYPVTNEQYGRFLQANPDASEPEYWSDRTFNGAKQPVVGVSWDDAQRFAEWAGARLPSEAEWEYTARAGTTSRYFWGDDSSRAEDYAWFADNSGERTQPVGQKKPNTMGLHDIAGNVFEWVEDCWHGNYEGAPTDGRVWEGGDCSLRVVRGGSWNLNQVNARCAYRANFNPDDRGYSLGFRVVCSSPIE